MFYGGYLTLKRAYPVRTRMAIGQALDRAFGPLPPAPFTGADPFFPGADPLSREAGSGTQSCEFCPGGFSRQNRAPILAPRYLYIPWWPSGGPRVAGSRQTTFSVGHPGATGEGSVSQETPTGLRERERVGDEGQIFSGDFFRPFRCIRVGHDEASTGCDPLGGPGA